MSAQNKKANPKFEGKTILSSINQKVILITLITIKNKYTFKYIIIML